MYKTTKMSAIEKEKSLYTIAEKLPYEFFDGNKIVFVDGSVGFALKLSFINVDSKTDKELMRIEKQLSVLVNSFREDLAVQFYFYKTNKIDNILDEHINTILRNQSNIANGIAQRRKEHFLSYAKANELFMYELWLFVRKQFNRVIEKVSLIPLPKKTEKYLLEQKDEHDKIVDELSQIESEFIHALRSVGFKVFIPNENEVINVIYAHLNPHTIELKGPICFNFAEHPRYQLASGHLYKAPKYIILDNVYHQIVTLNVWPTYTYITMIKHLTRLPFPLKIVLNVNTISKDKGIEKIKIRQARMDAMRIGTLFSSNRVDAEKDEYVRQLDDLLRDLASGSQRLFYVTLFVLVAANDEETLIKRTDAVLLAFREMEGAEGIKEEVANIAFFTEVLPGGHIEKNMFRAQLVKTENLVDILPVLLAPQTVGQRPVMPFVNRDSSFSFVDMLDPTLPNWNMLVVGATGSGKSFFTNQLMLNYKLMGSHIVIVDLGGSYRHTVEMFNGSYFEFGHESVYSINPFDVQNPTSDASMLYFTTLLGYMLTDQEHPYLSTDDKIILETAIKITYQRYEKPILSDLVGVLMDGNIIQIIPEGRMYERRIKQMARYLQRWTKGVYGDLINTRETTVVFNSPLIAFDLRNINMYPELLTVIFTVITRLISDKLLSIDAQKLLVFDEVWSLLLNEKGAAFLGELYRTMRKHGASVISITQAIEDFIESPQAGAILSNTSQVYLLKQAGTARTDILQKAIHLTDKEVNELLALKQEKGKFSEVLVKIMDRESFVGKVMPSKFEYWVSTTDPFDRQKFKGVVERFDGDILKALNFLGGE